MSVINVTSVVGAIFCIRLTEAISVSSLRFGTIWIPKWVCSRMRLQFRKFELPKVISLTAGFRIRTQRHSMPVSDQALVVVFGPQGNITPGILHRIGHVWRVALSVFFYLTRWRILLFVKGSSTFYTVPPPVHPHLASAVWHQ